METLLINTKTSECELFSNTNRAVERLRQENKGDCFIMPCREVKEGAELELWTNATVNSTFGYVAEILKYDLIWDDFKTSPDEPIKYRYAL